MKNILVTGVAGFIGFHVAKRLVLEGNNVVGIDNLDDYYDVDLKIDRLRELGIKKPLIKNELLSNKNFSFLKLDLSNHEKVVEFIIEQQFDIVINLAAQAGVRYSLENPRAYTRSNIDAFLSILEGSRYGNVKHLIFASSSSVYGLNTQMPLNEDQPTEHPMSMYAATKKANEMMAHSYSHLFDLPVTGLRFFTVYGPWGRPDMALFLFTKAILAGEPIKIFNHGKMIRDFTYVDDIVESIYRLTNKPPQKDKDWNSDIPLTSSSSAPFQVFNIGNSSPVKLMEYIKSLEVSLGKEAIKKYMDMQPGDVPATHASSEKLATYVGFKPKTSIKEGINEFVKWYLSYYSVK